MEMPSTLDVQPGAESTKAYELQADDAKEYIFALEGELQRICAGILTLIDEDLILSASAGEPKVF